jgi:hypothetical protein
MVWQHIVLILVRLLVFDGLWILKMHGATIKIFITHIFVCTLFIVVL